MVRHRSKRWQRTKSFSRKHARRLGFQALEQRAMLAGDVTAWVSGGTLFVRGNGEGNGIQITSPEEEVFVVTGLFQADDDTTVNGEASDEFSGVKRLDINLRGGDDLLLFTNDEERLFLCLEELFGEEDGGTGMALVDGEGDEDTIHVPGTVIINTGDGDDQVGIGNVHVGGDLIINTGRHEDGVALCEVRVGDDLVVTTGDSLDQVGVGATHVEDVITIATGPGESGVAFDSVGARVLTVTGGNDADEVRLDFVEMDDNVVVNTLGGEDAVSVCALAAESLIINAGAANDQVAVGHVHLSNDLVITTAGGDDGVLVDELFCGQIMEPLAEGEDGNEIDHDVGDDVVINTGSGHDNVIVGGSRVAASLNGDSFGILDVGDSMSIVLGSGDDGLAAGNLRLGGFLTVVAASGTDQVELTGVEVGKSATINMGPGDADELTLLGVQLADDLFALMGSGNDDFLAIDGSSGRKAFLRGGAGSGDTLERGTNDFESYDIAQFETEIS